MPRAKTIVAFVGGVVVALSFGLIPAEVVDRLRAWAVNDDFAPRSHRRRRVRQPRKRRGRQ